MKLKAIYNSKFSQWRLCHDQWCLKGETSIVATITSTGDDAADAVMAKKIADRFNAGATTDAANGYISLLPGYTKVRWTQDVPKDAPLYTEASTIDKNFGQQLAEINELCQQGLNSEDPKHWEAALQDILQKVRHAQL